MNKTLASVSVLIILVSSLITFLPANAENRTIIVPDDYPTIQAAIDIATDGDVVFVKAGTYNENITINKSLSLIGENIGSTFVVGEGTTALLIQHDNVNVTGFTFRRPSTMWWYFGIHLLDVQNCNVFGNKIESTFRGIWIVGSKYNNVYKNTLQGNRNGVSLQDSVNNNVSKNDIKNNPDCGILLQGAKDNLILDNYISSNGEGIGLDGDKPNTGNLIAGNTVTQNQYDGIEISSSGSSFNKIVGNSITSNGGAFEGSAGVMIAYDNNLIEGNNIVGNPWGIKFDASQRCTIDKNSIGSNVYGAINFVSRPYRGVAFHVIVENNFLNNNQCSFGYKVNENTWDNNSRGNYWSNYNGTDLDNDGIGDDPYIIASSNTDNYPLITPTSITVNIIDFLPSPTPPPTVFPSPSPSPTASPTQSPTISTSSSPLPTPFSNQDPFPLVPVFTVSVVAVSLVVVVGLLSYHKRKTKTA